MYRMLVLLMLVHLAVADLYAGRATGTYTNCLNYPSRLKNGYVSTADEAHDWECIQRSYQRNAEYHNISRSRTNGQVSYLEGLFKAVAAGKDCSPKHLRKEYRLLTDSERATFHLALTQLKNSGNFDALASLHVGISGAHGGPAFFNWHRIYLQMFENALKQHQPNCILPFWASSWDNEMTTPTASIMWDPRFAGDGFGFVTSGVAANWPSPVTTLTRNVGAGGGLITQQDVNNVLNQNSLVDIAKPFAAVANNLESIHDKGHGFIGGHMSQLASAPYDFVFYLHHAFIDCIYEEFRLKQISNGIDPETDWPVYYETAHGPLATISLRPSLTNIGVSSRKHACALYQPNCASLISCDCNTRCPSKYLTCDRERSICIPIEGRGGNGDGECCSQSSGYSYGGGGNGGGRYTPYQSSNTYERPSDRYTPPGSGGNYRNGANNGVQNSYCIDQKRCGTEYWAYVPIQINSYRPPNQNRYNSYPVKNGVPQLTYDIYDPRGYPSDNVYHQAQNAQSQSPAYQNCACRSTSGGVFIQSNGNRYEGNYREYQPVDQRQPMSSTVTYAAVMNPEYGNSESYVRVYDECGRMCRPRCRYSGSTTYVDCDGLIGLKVESPTARGRTYGRTYEEATQLLYSYTKQGDRRIPSYNPSNINIIYDCDYRGAWPWVQTADQAYDTEGYQGDSTYRPPTYPDPEPYVRRPQGGYY